MEDKIKLTDWMVSRERWVAQEGEVIVSANRIEREKELQVEDWMLGSYENVDQWLSELVEVDNEAPVKLQDWMLCCKEWQAGGM